MKKILAVVTAAVLALGCFASVSAATINGGSLVFDNTKGNYISTGLVTKSEYDAVNKGEILINGKKANAAQKKALKAIKDDKIFSLGNVSLDYSLTTDDYSIAGIQWTEQEKFDNLTHLYAQAGTEKVIRVFEITADDADASNPVKVSVVDSDVKASKKYALRHFKDGVWDNTSGKVTSVVNGVVTAEITKASPFALVELTGSAAPAADKDAAAKNATGTKTAPKTGEV